MHLVEGGCLIKILGVEFSLEVGEPCATQMTSPRTGTSLHYHCLGHCLAQRDFVYNTIYLLSIFVYF